MAWSYNISDQYPSAGHYCYPNNAEEVYDYLYNVHGFSYAATIGILANMEHESYLNPGQCQKDKGVPTGTTYEWGLGLVQWDDGTKLLDYAQSTGGTWYLGWCQMDFLMENAPESWIKRMPYSYDEYKSLDNYYLATQVFFENFERGTWHSVMYDYADYWNTYFQDTPHPPIPPDPPTPPTPTGRKMPLYMYLRKV